MPPIRSVKNQYPGINAHLNSWLQSEGGWNSFHSNHIADLTRLMRAQLLPMGYIADTVQSLQIRRFGAEEHTPESDIMIYDLEPEIRRSRQSSSTWTASTGQLVLQMPELLRANETDLSYHWAIAIYEMPEQGEPIAWIELLSPSNKPRGRDHETYRLKRLHVLQSGIVFVEIDFLHQQPPTFESLDSYVPRRRKEASDIGAYPYRVSVIEPRPVFFEGQGRAWQFNVDDALPRVTIPLTGDDVLEFDFGAAYRKTFEEMLYGQRLDYLQVPVNFERYIPDDQAKIVARMLAIIDAAIAGADLENTTLDVEPVTLEAGLARLEQLQQTHAGAE